MNESRIISDNSISNNHNNNDKSEISGKAYESYDREMHTHAISRLNDTANNLRLLFL